MEAEKSILISYGIGCNYFESVDVTLKCDPASNESFKVALS